jgi:hypothetical protein
VSAFVIKLLDEVADEQSLDKQSFGAVLALRRRGGAL